MNDVAIVARPEIVMILRDVGHVIVIVVVAQAIIELKMICITIMVMDHMIHLE